MKKSSNQPERNIERNMIYEEFPDGFGPPKPPSKLKELSNDAKKSLTQSEFFAQYRDPRWQKKRLEIMERDEFSCQSCQSKDNTLNVHHCVPYRKETKPWEYENDELITLCEDCHKELTQILKDCNYIVARNCSISDFAGEFHRILMEIDGMNPYQLEAVWKMIKEAKKM